MVVGRTRRGWRGTTMWAGRTWCRVMPLLTVGWRKAHPLFSAQVAQTGAAARPVEAVDNLGMVCVYLAGQRRGSPRRGRKTTNEGIYAHDSCHERWRRGGDSGTLSTPGFQQARLISGGGGAGPRMWSPGCWQGGDHGPHPHWRRPVTGWSPGHALAAFHDGVTVVCELAAQFSAEAWLAPTPCAEWRAAELAGHLRCVADDYHEYLDDAPASRLARLMATGADPGKLGRKLARQNAAELAALHDASGPEHIAAFAGSARMYALRARLL